MNDIRDNGTIESIPEDLWDDWVRFASEPHVLADVSGWVSLKAAEYGFDFFELSMFLSIVVKKPQIKPVEAPAGRGN